MEIHDKIRSFILSNLVHTEHQTIGIEEECILYTKENHRLPVNPGDEFSATDLLAIMNENVGIREHRHPGSVVTGAYYPKKPTDSVELTLSNPLQPYKMCELYDKYTGYNNAN